MEAGVVGGEVVIVGDEDVVGDVDDEVEDLDALGEGIFWAFLRSRLRDWGFTRSSIFTLSVFSSGPRASNRFESSTSSRGFWKGLIGAAFRFSTTLNMFPPWKSAWRGEKFGVSIELAPGRGYHVLHWVGEGPGYMDLH